MYNPLNIIYLGASWLCTLLWRTICLFLVAMKKALQWFEEHLEQTHLSSLDPVIRRKYVWPAITARSFPELLFTHWTKKDICILILFLLSFYALINNFYSLPLTLTRSYRKKNCYGTWYHNYYSKIIITIPKLPLYRGINQNLEIRKWEIQNQLLNIISNKLMKIRKIIFELHRYNRI